MKITIKNNGLIRTILAGTLAFFAVSAAQALPLWKIIPAPGSNPAQTVRHHEKVTIQYVVENKSGKYKKLRIRPMQGIEQTAVCELAPAGQAGSSCLLNLAITGKLLPAEGIHQGPLLCAIKTDGIPDPFQCYQPEKGHMLDITYVPSSGTAITVTPAVLNFVVGHSGFVTVTNPHAPSAENANNIAANIPGSSSISVQNTTCGTILAVGDSCNITFTASVSEGPSNINISGSNTNSAHVAVTVTPTPMATISVNPATLSFVENTTADVMVTNDAGSPVDAVNIAATIPVSSNISVQNTSCAGILAVGDSCNITFTAPASEGPVNISISGTNSNAENVAVTVTPTPMATISVNPATLSFVENLTADVTVTNDAGSPVTAANVVATIPGSSNISVQNTTCGTILAIGDSCTVTFTAAASEGPVNIDISGSNTNTENVAVTVLPTPMATISLNPATLIFAENSTANVTVTNDAGSPVDAANILATIPASTGISVQSTTCGSILAIGGNCSITFASSTQEGPTLIPVTGDNTNTVNFTATVTAQAQISITSPIQQSRIVTVSSMTPLSLVVANSGSSGSYANAITVSNKSSCPNLSVQDSNCASVAPGGSCTLELSSNTPYIPCTLVISGTNTNTNSALIAFYHQAGLVYQEDGGRVWVVNDSAQAFTSRYTSTDSDLIGASSTSDGTVNTDAIIAHPSCSSNPNNCAAQRCRNLGPGWSLPSSGELYNMNTSLCSNFAIPCNFGNFVSGFYWTSSESNYSGARLAIFPNRNTGGGNKTGVQNVRCVLAY